MATTKRVYAGKDVDMLTASATIVEQAISHKDFLIEKRPIWADPFLTDIQTSINKAFSEYLGIDNAKQMREQTQLLNQMQRDALVELAEFKVQLVEDFKSNKPRRDEILNQLGFTTNLKSAQKKDQQTLIELLLQFKTNMSGALQTEITTKGTNPTLIEKIIAYADQLKSHNITQETLKGSRKEVSQQGLTVFNDIYNQTISIAKISAKFFKENKAIKDQFSFAKTMKGLTAAKATKKETPPTNP
jgi:hypothetical protein